MAFIGWLTLPGGRYLLACTVFGSGEHSAIRRFSVVSAKWEVCNERVFAYTHRLSALAPSGCLEGLSLPQRQIIGWAIDVYVTKEQNLQAIARRFDASVLIAEVSHYRPVQNPVTITIPSQLLLPDAPRQLL